MLNRIDVPTSAVSIFTGITIFGEISVCKITYGSPTLSFNEPNSY